MFSKIDRSLKNRIRLAQIKLVYILEVISAVYRLMPQIVAITGNLSFVVFRDVDWNHVFSAETSSSAEKREREIER